MPLVNSTPSAGMAEAYSRPNAVVLSTQGNATTNVRGAAETEPAGAGPAAVVNLSQTAQSRSAASEQSGASAMPKPGINNGSMANEGGNAGALRSLLAERYDVQAARLNDAPS
jgi:hypothetical protein